VINPPLPVYAPSSESERLQGYPLSRQVLPGDEVYYLVQLSQALVGACIKREGRCNLEVGELALVRENLSIAMMAGMLPAWGGTNGTVHASQGSEIILQPYAKSGDGWNFIHKARALEGAEVAAIKPPPSFALPDLHWPN